MAEGLRAFKQLHEGAQADYLVAVKAQHRAMPAPHHNSGATLQEPLQRRDLATFPSSLGLPRFHPTSLNKCRSGKLVDLGEFLPEGLSNALDHLHGGQEKASGKRFPNKTTTQ